MCGVNNSSCHSGPKGIYLLIVVGKYDNKHETSTSGSPDVSLRGRGQGDAGFLDTSGNRGRHLDIDRNFYVADREEKIPENASSSKRLVSPLGARYLPIRYPTNPPTAAAANPMNTERHFQRRVETRCASAAAFQESTESFQVAESRISFVSDCSSDTLNSTTCF